MNNKRGHVIRTILGAYLVYLGVRILVQVVQNEPSNSEIMGVLAALFIIIGGGYAVFSIRNLIKIYKDENPKTPGLDETQELRMPDQADAASPAGPGRVPDEQGKSTVSMQQVGPVSVQQAEPVSVQQAGPEDNSENRSDEGGSEPEEADEGKEKTDSVEETEKNSSEVV